MGVQALIRSCPVAGDAELGERLVVDAAAHGLAASPEPAVLAELRRMAARGRPSGSREADRACTCLAKRVADVEWTVQLMQLQHGHTDHSLRVQSTREAIERLAAAGHIDQRERSWLAEAYGICSRLRNVVYLVTGRPADLLPTDQTVLTRMARALGLDGERQQLVELHRRATRRARQVVEERFWGGRLGEWPRIACGGGPRQHCSYANRDRRRRPGRYEAALVAAGLGAEVIVVNDEGLGGNSVLWDCVPSKTLITSAVAFANLDVAPALGVRFEGTLDGGPPKREVDFEQVLHRVFGLAHAQSADIRNSVEKAGARFVPGHGELIDARTVQVTDADGNTERIEDADGILIATGSDPRTLDTAPTDGEVVLSSRDLYHLKALPEHLVVVGSGATGAEYANAFPEFGCEVTFVVSRDRVLPGEDADGALVVEEVMQNRGMRTVKNARAAAVERHDGHAVVRLEDGRTLEGSHALLTIGQVPQSYGFSTSSASPPMPRARSWSTGQPDQRAHRVRGRRRHRPDHAGLRRRHGRPHRNVASARPGRRPAALGRGLGHHLHRPADRHRRAERAACRRQ